MRQYILAATMLLASGLTTSAQRTLSLDECLALALSNNRALNNAAIDIKMAEEQQREAHTKHLPEVSAQALAFYSFDKLLKGDGVIPDEIAMLGTQFAAMAGQPYSYGELNSAYSAQLSVMMPLYAGGQITTANKLAAVQQDVMRLQRDMKEKDIVSKVTENYWQIATVKYNLLTLDAAYRQMSEAEKTVGDYVKAGLTTRNDLLKVQLRKQELESDRLKLNNAEHVLRLLLAQMTGLTGEDVDIATDATDAPDPSAIFVASNDAASLRDELQLAGKGVEAQQLLLRMERGKRMPTVAVGVVGMHTGFGGLSDNVRNYLNTSVTNAMVMGTVKIPISQWWSSNHAIRRQKMKLEQSRNNLAETREKLQIDIEAAWANLNEAYSQIAIAQKSVEQAEENMRITSDQYKAGTIAVNDLLDAETLNRKARSQLSSALAAYHVKSCEYKLKVKQ